jgi:hypothetical protein
MNSEILRRLIGFTSCSALAAMLGACATAPLVGETRNQVIISVRDQKLTVIRPDHRRVTFPISTSKFGLGDRRGTYSTPTGEMEVAQKIGAGAPPGSVFKGRVRTGEIVRVDSPGRDAIVTRILALRGLEDGNRGALSRGIYIHGTPEERNIGRPVSYGCIRMRSKDVIQLFDLVKVGAKVQIIDSTMNRAIASNVVKPAPASSSSEASPGSGSSEETPGETAVAQQNNAAEPKKPDAAAAVEATKKTADGDKKQWAGTPSKLLAKEAATDAKNKKSKPLGATRSSPHNSGDGNLGSHESSRSSGDSL